LTHYLRLRRFKPVGILLLCWIALVRPIAAQVTDKAPQPDANPPKNEDVSSAPRQEPTIAEGKKPQDDKAPQPDANPPKSDDAASGPLQKPTVSEDKKPQEPPEQSETSPVSRLPKTICQGRKITKIDVAGQGRVTAEDIRATIRLRPGLPCTDAEITRDVKALWDLGYFKDIVIEAQPKGNDVVLTFRVQERPAISSHTFVGNDELDESDFKDKITLEEGAILSVPEIRTQLDKIRNLYAEKGFFLAQVNYDLVPQPNNQVQVRFLIKEGAKVVVRRIRFVGNKKIDSDDLRSVMQTSQTNFFSFITTNNRFQRANFEEDVNRLRALYYDRGYLTVNVSEGLVQLSPDRLYVDITIPITEGPRFRVSKVSITEVDVDGKEVEPLPGRKKLREQIHLNPGDWFSRSIIAQDIQAITRYYRDRGYAKVEITPNTDLNNKKRLVALEVSIRRGPLCYVQRINVKGNTKTRDDVIRREMKIVEGELYNQTRVELSKDRITALGYFEKVDISETPGAANDRIVINYEVAERATGTFQVGAGFSSLESFLFTGQVMQQNLFGRGQTFSINLQLSGIRQLVQVEFLEPYFLGSRWSADVEAYTMMRQLRDYDRDSTGGSLTFGHPIFLDDLRLLMTYRIEDVSITPATGGAFVAGGANYNLYPIVPLRNLFRSGFTSAFRLALQWDSRDNRLFPTRGVLAMISSEISDKNLGSSSDFIRHRANFRYYYPLIWGIVSKLNVDWGLITSRDILGVPIYERFFLGGIFDVRGFTLQSIGPRIAIPTSIDPNALSAGRGTEFGGNMEFYYNFEIEFPIIESVGIKGVLFTDGGNAWNMEQPLCSQAPRPQYDDPAATPCGVHPFSLRTSIGFGLRWFSPLGPLRFEWGYPFHPRRPYEDTVEFQFTVGNAF
jgi:outer membrane protein insertion porin family